MSVIADLLVKLGLNTAGFTTGIKGVEGELGKFKKNAATMAKATAAAVLAIGTASVVEFAKSQDAGYNLAATLKSVKGGTEEVYNQFLELSSLLSKKSTFEDDDIVNAMSNLIDMTGDYNFALKNSQTLVDIAARKGYSLQSVSQTLGLAYKGNTRGLRAYGIVVDETMSKEEIFEALQRKYAGSAEARTKSLTGRWQQTKNDIANGAEYIGGNIADMAMKAVAFIKETDDMDKASVKFYKQWEKEHGAIDTLEEEIESGKAWTAEVEKMRKKTAEAKKETAALGDETAMQHDAWVKATAAISDYSDETEALVEAQEAQKEEEEMLLEINRNRTKEMIDSANETAEVLGGAMSSVVSTFLDSQATMNEKMAGLLKAGLTAVIDAVSVQIDAYLAAATAEALATGGLSTGLLAGIIAQKVVVEGLKAAVGTISLAEGGIAYGPTHAIVGDAQSPEVVAPLHKLQPMISKAVNQSQSNKITIVVNAGSGNGEDIGRKTAQTLDKYFKKRGSSFYGAYKI